MKLMCITCGTTFHKCASIIKNGGGKFCSIKCYGVWQSKNRIEEKSHYWKGGKVDCTCKQCGLVFKRYSSAIKKGEGIFCSVACTRTYTGKQKTGVNNPRWKGGITSITQKIRDSVEYNKWRHQIFQRDNFTCQKCGSTKSGELIAHHKKSFSSIIQGIKKELPFVDLYLAAIAFSELWDISIGVTLCTSCHASVHVEIKKLILSKGGRVNGKA